MTNYKLTSNSWGKEEINAIYKVIESGQFTYKNKVKEFEKKYSKYFGMKYSVMTNSGSSANLLAIASLFFKKKIHLKGVMKFWYLQLHGQQPMHLYNNMV